nr:LysM peptidoglycan-binding domain-containing protein [Oenococcus oeni]
MSAIATANNISNPDYIYVGEVLTIGSSTSTSTSTSSVVQRRVLLRAIPSLLEIL